MLGYGPIQPLLDDPEVSEVMVNGSKKVYIEKNGQLIRTKWSSMMMHMCFGSLNALFHRLAAMWMPISPTVDGRLPDGSRVNAVDPACGN